MLCPTSNRRFVRLQTFRHLHACPGCFRLERLPGGSCTHWEKVASFTAHAGGGHSSGNPALRKPFTILSLVPGARNVAACFSQAVIVRPG
jgi:hypothetical protein